MRYILNRGGRLQKKVRPRGVPGEPIAQEAFSRALAHARLITAGQINQLRAQLMQLPHELDRAEIGPVVHQILATEKPLTPKFLGRLPSSGDLRVLDR